MIFLYPRTQINYNIIGEKKENRKYIEMQFFIKQDVAFLSVQPAPADR